MSAISDTLKNAIKNKDVVSIKSSFYTIVLSDPAFQTGKFDEALEYVKEQNVEGVIDEHDGEALKPEDEWNEEYFDLLVSKLQDNFSETRIMYIKQVSKKLYSPVIKLSSEEKMVSAPVKNVYGMGNNKQGKPIMMKTNSDDYRWIGVLGVILAIIFVLKHLLKEDK